MDVVLSSFSFFFFSSRRRHTRLQGDWSSDVCSSDLIPRCPSCSLQKRGHTSHWTRSSSRRCQYLVGTTDVWGTVLTCSLLVNPLEKYNTSIIATTCSPSLTGGGPGGPPPVGPPRRPPRPHR